MQNYPKKNIYLGLYLDLTYQVMHVCYKNSAENRKFKLRLCTFISVNGSQMSSKLFLKPMAMVS